MKRNIEHQFYSHIEKAIDRANDKADKYRNAFYGMRIGLIIIAGIITIMSGLKGFENDSNRFLNLILFLGTLITALTSIDTLFQIETKKNIYKLMLVELREIRSEIVYYYEIQPDKLEERIRSHLFPKYQAITAYSKTLIEKIDKEQNNLIEKKIGNEQNTDKKQE